MPDLKQKMVSRVLEIRHLPASTYLLRLERNNLEFKAGQYLVVTLPGTRLSREYSIYSAEEAPYLELLIKEIPQGELSVRLKNLMPGDELELSGPFGFFILRMEEDSLLYFIATGTGISPFHSMIGTHPNLNYQLLHGTRTAEERSPDFPPQQYLHCTSRSEEGDFQGRVTDFLRLSKLSAEAIYYLCGNSAMVNEASEILENAGISAHRIRTEVFF